MRSRSSGVHREQTRAGRSIAHSPDLTGSALPCMHRGALTIAGLPERRPLATPVSDAVVARRLRARSASAVSLALQLDPTALVGAGGVMGVVDDRVAGVGLELAVDDHRGANHDWCPRRQGEVVVHLHHPPSDLQAEAFVAALGALGVGQYLHHLALDGHLSWPAGRDRCDQGVVVGPRVAAASQQQCQQQAAERGDAGAERGLHTTILRQWLRTVVTKRPAAPAVADLAAACAMILVEQTIRWFG